MDSVKKLVLLANSRKHSGRCIAGKEVSESGFGDWIRPISDRTYAEISRKERSYENGMEPQILDIIEVPLVKSEPFLYQTENHLIDAKQRWLKKGRLQWANLNGLLDHPTNLWFTGDPSSNYGLNDRVSVSQASQFTSSLALIEPDSLNVSVDTEGAEYGTPRRRVRADFRYNGRHYTLVVTDVIARQKFLAKPNGDYPLIDAFLCVSLGEEYSGFCYKLVATVFNEELLATNS